MLTLHISKFLLGTDDGSYEFLHEVPAMQRRRLSSLAKMALNTARAALLGQAPVDYIVWSSRFGDEKNTLQILQDIAQLQSPSPTQFSVSVHNAVAGLYSILFQDDTPSTSLSSHANAIWQDAVFEAYSFLKSQHKSRALIVYYDQPLPPIYQDEVAMTAPLCIAACISLAPATVRITSLSPCQQQHELQILSFMEFWNSTEKTWQSNAWEWQKCE